MSDIEKPKRKGGRPTKHEVRYRNSGRPTKMTPELIEKLEYVYCKGFTDQQAADFAGIHIDTIYNYCKNNPEFSEKKEALKKMPNLKAKMNIVEALDSSDPILKLQNSRFWVERKMKDEFSTRTETTGKDGEALIPDKIIIDDIKGN